MSYTNGSISWTAPASINLWFIQYLFDEIRVSPHFASEHSFYTNARTGSMSFPDFYPSYLTYSARVVSYYET